jgi:hypothetical protein
VSTGARRYWLGVVSADHVARGVAQGIAQIGHGKRAGLQRMQRGDGFVYYSPRTSLDGGGPLRAFTAVGTIADDEIWQHHENEQFQPWRRRVSYDRVVRPVPVSEVTSGLDLTSAPNWGYALRRGLLPLTQRDFDLIRAALCPEVARA